MPPTVAALLALFGVVVEGSSTCPAPAAVEERLRSLLPADPRPEVARLSNEAGGLRVTLLRADGSTAGSRDLTGEYSCDELADAAAVVISTWQLEPVERRLLPAAPAPPPAVVAAAPPLRTSRHWELGAGAGASLSGTDLAPAVLLLGGVRGQRLGLAGRAHVSGNREAAVPAGSAAWRRALLAVGPELYLPAGRVIAAAHLGVGLSWLSIAGRGFTDAQRHDDLIAGLEGGLRLAWDRPGLRPWLDAGVAFWPFRSVVYQDPDQQSAALPRLEVLLTLGLSFAR